MSVLDKYLEPLKDSNPSILIVGDEQGSADFLNKYLSEESKSKIGLPIEKFDVIIDVVNHKGKAGIILKDFNSSYSKLSDGGIYIILKSAKPDDLENSLSKYNIVRDEHQFVVYGPEKSNEESCCSESCPEKCTDKKPEEDCCSSTPKPQLNKRELFKFNHALSMRKFYG